VKHFTKLEFISLLRKKIKSGCVLIPEMLKNKLDKFNFVCFNLTLIRFFKNYKIKIQKGG